MGWTHSLAARFASEYVGSLALYTLAIGGVFNALLPRTKGEGMGLLAISLSVGLGVGFPTAILYRVRPGTCRRATRGPAARMHGARRRRLPPPARLPHACWPAAGARRGG